MNVDEVIQKYIELRDEKTEIGKRHEAELVPIGEKMRAIEAWLLAKLNQDGVNAFNTEAGTAFKTVQTSVSLADAHVFKLFILAPLAEAFGIDAAAAATMIRWDVTDLRAGKKGIQDYLEHTNEVPPGVNLTQNTAVSVRRK